MLLLRRSVTTTGWHRPTKATQEVLMCMQLCQDRWNNSTKATLKSHRKKQVQFERLSSNNDVGRKWKRIGSARSEPLGQMHMSDEQSPPGYLISCASAGPPGSAPKLMLKSLLSASPPLSVSTSTWTIEAPFLLRSSVQNPVGLCVLLKLTNWNFENCFWCN